MVGEHAEAEVVVLIGRAGEDDRAARGGERPRRDFTVERLDDRADDGCGVVLLPDLLVARLPARAGQRHEGGEYERVELGNGEGAADYGRMCGCDGALPVPGSDESIEFEHQRFRAGCGFVRTYGHGAPPGAVRTFLPEWGACHARIQEFLSSRWRLSRVRNDKRSGPTDTPWVYTERRR